MPDAASEEIPVGLRPYISEFLFPSGGAIRRRRSSNYGLAGWTVELPGEQCVYPDGTIDQAPRFRAYSDLGFPGGQDDLKTDDDWRAVEELRRHLTEQLIMTLADAWALARSCGAANRRVEVGETVIVRSTADVAIVVDDGKFDDGRYVRLRRADHDAPFTASLMDLQLADS
jgi:hypothetical protein